MVCFPASLPLQVLPHPHAPMHKGVYTDVCVCVLRLFSRKTGAKGTNLFLFLMLEHVGDTKRKPGDSRCPFPKLMVPASGCSISCQCTVRAVCSAPPACLSAWSQASYFPPRTLSLSTSVTIAALLSDFLPASVCIHPGSLLIHFFIHSFKSRRVQPPLWSPSRTLECLCPYVLITICLFFSCLPVSEALLHLHCVCSLLTCVLSVAPSP